MALFKLLYSLSSRNKVVVGLVGTVLGWQSN